MQAPVYNLAGEVVDNIEISDKVFGVPFNEALVHQSVLRQQANARQGNASTKTRGNVSGSTRKLYKQKGTGSARAGSIKSPLRRGGGIVFGPHPRDYHQAMPKSMRRLALRCVLSAKLEDGELKILESFKFDEIKTKNVVSILDAMQVDKTTLVVTGEGNVNLVKSARNLPGVKTLPANLLNVVDIISHNTLLIEVNAVRIAEQLWGESSSGEENDATA
ncbi:MAG TPA: 50S ribosomal protein L4 [Dehalococcoidales bacterium]|jgi:large subunit ribosomal protein L4|nr:50S ribosomal protein L4 [Dehalococcoidales bacterium]